MSGIISKKRIEEIIDYYYLNGEVNTAKVFNISIETLNRYIRNYEQTYGEKEKFKLNKVLADIQKRYSEKELLSLSKGQKLNNEIENKIDIKFDGEKVKIGFFTDTHAGSIYFNEKNFDKMLNVFDKEKIDIACMSGDLTDGMSNRPDHIYQLTHIGYDKQKEYAIKLMSKLNKTCYCVDGNHDRYFIKSSGAYIIKDVCEAAGHKFIGFDTGDFSINGITIKLWHGEDGSSYAVSYRLQKLIEALTGGEKPAVLLAGHTHKQGYFFDRHIHVVSGGAMCRQSAWMRSKRLANHYGFHVIELTINKMGVSSFKIEWYPFYQ